MENTGPLRRTGETSTLIDGVPKVVVFGSCMIDFSCFAPRLPHPGETLIGHKFLMGFGGKGANQCVSAAKLGATTALVARLGDDSFGLDYLKRLKNNQVDTTCVKITKDCASGIAQITVADNGENQIVITLGANMMLSKADATEAATLLTASEVQVFQLETPLEATVQALKICSGKGKSIVNAAPAIANPDPHIYTLADIFCVNETEAEIMSGVPVKFVSDAGCAIKKFLEKGCHTVVITMGVQGVVYASEFEPDPVHVPAQKVVPVDTTGAGDSFIGAMAYYLAYHPDLHFKEVIQRSCDIATISVQAEGTQESFPLRADVPVKLL